MGIGVPMALRTEQELLVRPEATTNKAIVEARSIDKRYDTGELQVHALRGVELRRRARRDGRDHGPERLGQDDAAQLPLRARRASTAARS